MPESKRKHRAVFNPGSNNKHQGIPQAVEHIANEMGLALDSLLSWKVYPSGKVVLIAPNGMKFVVEVPQPENEVTIAPSIKGRSKPKAAEVSYE